MSYRKFSADFIFTGYDFAPPDHALITDDQGTIIGIVPAREAGEDVSHLTGMLTPGFINAHCHLELSHMKGRLPEATGLVDFLIRVIRERGATSEEIIAAMAVAEEEMLDNGIVAVADTCNTAFSAPLKAQSALHWRNFIEVLGFTEVNAKNRLEDAEKVLASFEASKFTNSSLTPHAPYSVSPGLFRLINERAAGKRISIHNQECIAEDDLFTTGEGEMFRLYESLHIDASFFHATGKSSLQSYLPLLDKPSGLLLVHNTYIREHDLEALYSRKGSNEVFLCLCPGANKYIESTLPPVEAIRHSGITIILGTDSYASNWQLSILEEIKHIHLAFPMTPMKELLRWATINGAKAIEMDHALGSFEKGKKPGIVCIEGITPDSLDVNAVSRRIR